MNNQQDWLDMFEDSNKNGEYWMLISPHPPKKYIDSPWENLKFSPLHLESTVWRLGSSRSYLLWKEAGLIYFYEQERLNKQ